MKVFCQESTQPLLNEAAVVFQSRGRSPLPLIACPDANGRCPASGCLDLQDAFHGSRPKHLDLAALYLGVDGAPARVHGCQPTRVIDLSHSRERFLCLCHLCPSFPSRGDLPLLCCVLGGHLQARHLLRQHHGDAGIVRAREPAPVPLHQDVVAARELGALDQVERFALLNDE